MTVPFKPMVTELAEQIEEAPGLPQSPLPPSGLPCVGWLSYALPAAFGCDAKLAGVHLPGALSRKFLRAEESFGWYCLGGSLRVGYRFESGQNRIRS